MKKIILTESQLKILTKCLVTEQQTNLGGLPVLLDLNGDTSKNPNFGTLIFKVNNQPIKIRLFTEKLGNVNVVKLFPTSNGVNITTLKGTKKELGNDIVNNLTNFVKNQRTNTTLELDSSFITGKLFAKKI